MNHFFFSNELIIAGRALSVARDKGEVEKDEEGVQSAQTLGQKIAWMVKKLYGFAFMVNIKAMLVVLDRGYAISPFDEFGNKFFHQRCFAGIGFTDNGYDWRSHI
jgi:hypothetical protein